ncbi:MAG TPA: NADP-dependent malic enzyme [Cyclobacteriaceae bacterium]|jgi:malate dehydrogenase (oxaloacetate-decarboxylating)(NADP+)|nr:NADP-dependent malic enzyme [Cytophagales bacterium]HNT50004.1 NADP-dependent malic enzyme [Cyclobacteriaceae bacterium]HRE67097.1 NADP-dependent malic enzyme [Cyclobacteriaceae bacterium]HRF35463.1 NADP-dependent malic enzyme [Cyclobacteriaceae bacterium]
MSIKIRKQDALNYHTQGQPGKVEVVPTKMLSTQLDLALAYSPGVAEPCKEIAANKDDVYKYTSKGNLVAVISNGTAVLGLGNIGPEAAKPVMEGKAVLFKKYAGIDSFDIEIDEEDPDAFIKIVKALEPTFGGVNLEDIKAPECFKIETELREKMHIPIMHDDQHGTAIISSAALLNALEIVGKKIDEIILVVNGAGAAAVSCSRLYLALGLKKENLIMCDSKGVINTSRTNLDVTKTEFITKRKLNTLQEAMKGCDVFVGLSVADAITPEDVLSMAKDPIVFALANPNPEISYALAMKTRPDLIMGTGRSDHPNQVNNVLGFPYIFRGALDVRATEINEAMKLAAVHALAALAKEPVPDIVFQAYGIDRIQFGRDYLIPKPLDPRLITTVSPAVAKAAMDSGMARNPITDWGQYHQDLLKRVGIDQKLTARIIDRAKQNPKHIVFAEADHPKILKAAQVLQDEKIAYPILLGSRTDIERLIQEHGLDLSECKIVDPREEKERTEKFAKAYHQKRQRKGIAYKDAERVMRDRNAFGAMMVEFGEADALISGLTKDYPKTILPSLQIIGMAEGVNRVAGMYIIMNKKGTFFFADCTVNVDPNVNDLVEIIGLAARGVKFFDIEPRVAMLSYSNFGSSKGPIPEKASEAVRLAKQKYPDLIVDGDIQANVAFDTEIQSQIFPFSALAKEGANTLIFPNLTAGNIAYKLLMEIGGAEAIGPILLGMKKPVHILQLGSSIRDIISMAAIAVVDAQMHNQNNRL